MGKRFLFFCPNSLFLSNSSPFVSHVLYKYTLLYICPCVFSLCTIFIVSAKCLPLSCRRVSVCMCNVKEKNGTNVGAQVKTGFAVFFFLCARNKTACNFYPLRKKRIFIVDCNGIAISLQSTTFIEKFGHKCDKENICRVYWREWNNQ